MTDVSRALKALRPGAAFSVVERGETVEIVWHDPEQSQPSHEEIEAWLAGPQMTIEAVRAAVEAHIEATAQERDYSGAVSCASYVSSTNATWAAEAAAFIAWRDAVWRYAFTELDKAMAGERQPPESPGAFISELPQIEWPEPE